MTNPRCGLTGTPCLFEHVQNVRRLSVSTYNDVACDRSDRKRIKLGVLHSIIIIIIISCFCLFLFFFKSVTYSQCYKD